MSNITEKQQYAIDLIYETLHLKEPPPTTKKEAIGFIDKYMSASKKAYKKRYNHGWVDISYFQQIY